MTEGGIFPAIFGTFLVTVITAALAVPLGVFAAIYLNEYAGQGILTRIIRLSIRNLAGVPSIVYGLFGVVLFVNAMRLGTSILTAGLTLGLLTLPWTITASEEALKTVPNSYRDGALALGATKWQAIRTNVLPYAMPGHPDRGHPRPGPGGRGDGPHHVHGGGLLPAPPSESRFGDQFMALPYHLYIMSTQHHAIQTVRPIAYGTALVLIAFVLGMNLLWRSSSGTDSQEKERMTMQIKAPRSKRRA